MSSLRLNKHLNKLLTIRSNYLRKNWWNVFSSNTTSWHRIQILISRVQMDRFALKIINDNNKYYELLNHKKKGNL